MPRYFRAPPRIPTRAEVDAVLRVADTDDRARDHLLVAVAAGTGLLVHELVALDWGQRVSEAVRWRNHGSAPRQPPGGRAAVLGGAARRPPLGGRQPRPEAEPEGGRRRLGRRAAGSRGSTPGLSGPR